MSIYSCRVCDNKFLEKPLIHYDNMPKAAQNFPDLDLLNCEKSVDLTVCQCSGCGLVQLSNDPVPYYREVIRAASVSDVVKNIKTEQFSNFIQKYSLQGRKLIDIGCGRGEFLSLLQPFDIYAIGLEYSESSVAECIKKGLNASKGYFDSEVNVLPKGPFDAFLLHMFLEHMPDPNSALKGIYNNLADGAVGIVEVPNFDMVLRNKLFSEFIGDHLLYFSKDTLQTTMNINGFEIIECTELRDEYVLSAVVKKREKVDVSRFHDYQIKITMELENYISRFKENRVAIWGAGHQALAILALTKIKNKIKCVLDSAPFKQGKYTPATHLPIVAPDVLAAGQIDAVIIMAAAYSDEVATIIRKQYSSNIFVAILRDYGLEMI